jgi:hypothetical protein
MITNERFAQGILEAIQTGRTSKEKAILNLKKNIASCEHNLKIMPRNSNTEKFLKKCEHKIKYSSYALNAINNFNETEQENEMERLKEDLKKLAETWNASGEYDGTEFEGRYFISDDDLDEFAQEHGLAEDDKESFDEAKIQVNCDCQLNCYYYHGNRHFREREVIFNETEQEKGMEEKVFGRMNEDGNVDLLHVEDGEAVTRYEGCWPLNSELSGAYEHPAGIELSVEDAEELGIEIEV